MATKREIETWFEIPKGYSRRFVLIDSGVKHELEFSGGRCVYTQKRQAADPNPVLSWASSASLAVIQELGIKGPAESDRGVSIALTGATP